MSRLTRLIAVLLFCTASHPAQAQEAQPAIMGVIQNQLDAFQVDNGEAAFSYASPGIRRMFGTVDRFMSMVRQSYQPVYRPAQVQFLDLLDSPRGPVQRVMFVGPDGDAVMGHYLMEQQPDGTWRIDGVFLSDVEDAGA